MEKRENIFTRSCYHWYMDH